MMQPPAQTLFQSSLPEPPENAAVTFDGYESPSILAVEDAKRFAVEFTTMSKGYNMAGWRSGFCAGNREIVWALGTIKTDYDYGMFRPIQIAAAQREAG